MDTQLLIQFQKLLQDRCGLYFAQDQQHELQVGVLGAMRAIHYGDPQTYYHDLNSLPLSDLRWKQLITLLTIGETYFFRNSWHFRALRDDILPTIIERRRRYGLKNLRLWSAGCASGEEPYSLAILLYELLPDIHDWHITILGTDINETYLEKASNAIYSDWSFRLETPTVVRERYFTARPDGRYEVVPDVRRLVHFAYLNLVEDSFPSHANNTLHMDMIFCRNVTIYFDRPTTHEVVGRFRQALVDGGWLVVGHSEPTSQIYNQYEIVNHPNAVFYRKPNPLDKRVRKLATGPLSQLDDIPPPASPTPQTAPQREADIQSTLDEVRALLHQQQREPARQRLSDILEHQPQHIDALLLLAKIAGDEGQFTWMHEILDAVDDLAPLLAQAHYLRALAYQHERDSVGAKGALRRALYADRDFALAHYTLGELLYSEGNHSAARRSWQNALKLLENAPPDSLVPFGDGLLTGTLCHTLRQRLNTL